MDAEPVPIGVIGLGNMGSALAENLLAAGLDVVAFDVAGPERAPARARFVGSVAELAAEVTVVVLSLPDGEASQQVEGELLAADPRRTTQVVDTSTVGVPAARDIAALLAAADIGYVDAPVSGGPAGARARTLTVIYAASDAACKAVQPTLAALSDRRYRVSDQPGAAQALKLANNFLSATALAATSEAIAFGMAAGLDMATMLEVLNASSGRNTATADKFPNHVLTGRYASGFANTLMAKDVDLYLSEVGAAGLPADLGAATAQVWQRFATAEPGADFTRIHPYICTQPEDEASPGLDAPS